MDNVHAKKTGLLFLITVRFTKLCAVSFIALFAVSTCFATEHLVIQENEKFSEIFLKIENSDVVRFVNLDLTNHQLSFKHRNQFSLSRDISPGTSQAVLFSQPGVYDIQCDVHPDMKLTVFVPHVDLVHNN